MELLEQLRTQGKLKTKCCFDEHLTYHDPCNISRRGGVMEQPRHLLNQVAPNFVEMHEAKEMNWCCGGGGGVSSNERAEPLRLQVFNVKKRQIEELKLLTLVTSCSNCRSMLEEGLEEYGMDVSVIGLTELIADHLEEG